MTTRSDLAREVVEQMGAAVGVESEANQASRFGIELSLTGTKNAASVVVGP